MVPTNGDARSIPHRAWESLARPRQLGACRFPRDPQGDERLSVLYDPDWDEDARLAEWCQVLERSSELPAVLRAALALDTWADMEVLQRGGWIGGLLVAAFLRQEAIGANHLACLHVGAQMISRERRRSNAYTERVLAHIDAIREAAFAGLKEHDRLLFARERMERLLRGLMQGRPAFRLDLEQSVGPDHDKKLKSEPRMKRSLYRRLV